MRKMNYVLYVFLFISILVSLGIINWAGADFKLNVWSDGSFWLDTVSKTLSFLGSFILATLWGRDTLILNDELYEELSREVKEAGDTLIDADFPEFISRFNRKNKIKTWVEQKTHELDKHVRKVSQKTLDELRLPVEEHSIKTIRWVEKRTELLEQITPEYIEENIDYKIFKYPVITVSEIQTGVYAPASKSSVLKKGHVRQVLQDRWIWVVGNILINAFLASIIIHDGSWGSQEYFNVAFILFGMFLNIIFGLRNGKEQYQTIDIYNLNTRKMIFIEWGFEREKKHQTEVRYNGDREIRTQWETL